MTDDLNYHSLAETARTRRRAVLDAGTPVLIFGAGRFGRDLCTVLLERGHRVAGFVETTPGCAEVLGLPVIGWEASRLMLGQARLVLGIFNRGMAFDQLQAIAARAGWDEMVMPWDVYDQFGGSLGWRFWLGPTDVLVDQIERVARVADRLGDAESRSLLYRICAFRLGLDPGYGSFRSDDVQYFNDLTLPHLPSGPLSFVDCGAYNGDTILQFAAAADCRTAYLFEPDPTNYRSLCQATLRHPANPLCLPLAVYNSYSILSFYAGDGEGGAIGTSGNVHIAAAALDDVLGTTKVDFLKLDVEGSEALALRGSSEMIKHNRPVIAMSLYHKMEDVWELPELLFDLCPDYRFYIRQHYYNTFDSVLYARPTAPEGPGSHMKPRA